MRFFRYKDTNKNQRIRLKAQYKALTEDVQRAVRKEKTWENISKAVTFAVFFAFLAAGICLLTKLPKPSYWLWRLLAAIGKLIAALLIFFISGIFTVGVTRPLWKKVESLHPSTMKKACLSNACRHLREYYGLQEPYLITKCFDATDKRFQNHDVCLFVVGEELRLTTDLVKGFLHEERDLGCYAFKREEIVLSKRQNEGRLIAELKTENAVFLLGYRAKSFIDKNFMAR